MLKNSTFGSREVSKLTGAYEVALTELGITDREDPRTEIIASAFLHRASFGKLNLRDLADFAIRRINENGIVERITQPPPTSGELWQEPD
jgi:hypothetical protein